MARTVPRRDSGDDLTLVAEKVAPDYRALHRIADRLAPSMRRAFLDAVAQLRTRVGLDSLRDLVARDPNHLGAFWEAVESELPTAMRPTIREVFLQSAAHTGQRLGMSFDLTNPRAVEAIDQHAAALVQQVTEESRAAIRTVLRMGFQQGLDVPEMARRIRGSIGLTERFAQAVENYRMAQETAGVLPSVVEQRVGRYADQLLRLRATTIARTETIAAANRGQQAAWLTAQEQGLVGAEQKRQWLITPDDKLCPICEGIPDMNPNGVGLNEPFQTEDGLTMNPPQHPLCRCSTSLMFAEEL